jgi:hypothetical protein
LGIRGDNKKVVVIENAITLILIKEDELAFF